MSNNEEIKVEGAFDEGVNPAVDTSYVNIPLTSSNVLYTLNLADNHAIQNFAIDGPQIYTTQRPGKTSEDIILAVSDISGTSATQDKSVTVKNAGHGQTLEYITRGPFYGSLLFSFNSNKDANDNIWSTEIGILAFGPDITSPYIKKFTDLDCANESGTTNYAHIVRADAALSTDQSTILIWTRNDIGLDMFTGYDFYTFCSELANSGSDTVSFKNNKYMKEACKFCFAAQTSRILGVPTSFQGIELSNESNDVYSIYVVSGTENDNTNTNAKNRIYRFTSNGVLKKAGKIIHDNFNSNVKYEIEGVKISGDNLLFGFVPAGTGVDKKHPFIMKISKSILQ